VICRLGNLWREMKKEEKDEYFHLTRLVEKEHKEKYPGK
jgi:hypothetical protein